MDYLTPQRETRKQKNAPPKPYDWTDIVRRSKMAKQTTTKQRTFITHLNQNKWSKDDIGFNMDGSKIKKKQMKEGPSKRLLKFDEKQEQLFETIEFTIKYLIKMRCFPYVCQTDKYNALGIRVFSQFYVDEKGNTLSDVE